jgi:DNA-binding transcriptional LysR family regulator
MNQAEPSWEHYRTFRAALAEGSLSGAARALGLTQPTVARHLDQLEAALGRRLFLRTQRGLSPTEAALAIAPNAEAMAAAAAALRRTADAERGAVAGTVRISASEVVAAERLPPVLAGIRARHPGLALEVVASNVVEDLLRRDADIAVRMVDPVQEALVARRIGRVELGLHATPAYLARRGVPARIDEVAGFDLIGFDRETPALRAVIRQFPVLAREGIALRSDSDLVQCAAIRAGFGIGVCQVGLAAGWGLERVLAAEFALWLPVWVVMHEDLRASARCRAVFDALVAGLGPGLETGP